MGDVERGLRGVPGTSREPGVNVGALSAAPCPRQSKIPHWVPRVWMHHGVWGWPRRGTNPACSQLPPPWPAGAPHPREKLRDESKAGKHPKVTASIFWGSPRDTKWGRSLCAPAAGTSRVLQRVLRRCQPRAPAASQHVAGQGSEPKCSITPTRTFIGPGAPPGSPFHVPPSSPVLE